MFHATSIHFCSLWINSNGYKLIYQLIAVGVNPQTAEVDACRMEHAVSDESFQKLKEHAMRGIAAQKIDNTFDNFPVKK